MDLDLVIYPQPSLRRVCRPVEVIDEEVRERARRMFEIMYAHKGVGLAAPQVGWDARLFVMNPTGEPADERVVVNPVIASREGTEVFQEGCLSLPEVSGKIERSQHIRLEGYDLEGEEVSADLEGFPARVVQHEFDHLEGILIVDRMSPAERTVADRVLKDLARRRAEAEHAHSGTAT